MNEHGRKTCTPKFDPVASCGDIAIHFPMRGGMRGNVSEKL